MKTLIEFKKFVDKITSTTKRLEKEVILKNISNNEDIKQYLYFLLNPFIVTGISDKKLSRDISGTVSDTKFSTVIDLLKYIEEHNTGTDTVLSNYHTFANTLSDDLHLLLDKLITKNLQLGIDSKTVNKVIPKLIPDFNVMLANKYFDNPSVVDSWKGFAITTKIDGSRILAVKKNGKAYFYTRQGQEYLLLEDLKQELESSFPDNIVLDGELMAINTTKDDAYKNTMKLSRIKGEKHGLKMLVFDYIPFAEYENQKGKTVYKERRKKLDELFLNKSHTYFELLPVIYSGNDSSKILQLLDDAISKHEEGIMINNLDAPYKFTRTNDLLKVKKMKDMDLECIGFLEGDNKYSGTLGALIVDYEGYKVKVGSGFSDELRDEIWKNKDSWLGRTIVVRYFEETYNAKDGKSLRFPVYVDWRDDK